jgi:hypothetical protein
MKSSVKWLLILLLTTCQGCNVFTGSSTEEMPSPPDQEITDSGISSPDLFADTPIQPPTWHCPENEPLWITGFEVYQPPHVSEPSARESYIDPIFGTCVIRVTDRAQDLSPDDDSGGLKNEYSRVQSFNADNSLILVRGIEATWYLYETASLRPIRQIPIVVEPRWDSKDPNTLYYVDETRLMAYHVSDGGQDILYDFADDFPGQRLSTVWTRYEGSPSFDSRYWGLMAEDMESLTVGFLIYDMLEDRLIAKRLLPDPAEIDSVTISPLGNYFLAYFDEYCERGEQGSDSNPCGLMVYDRELNNGRSLLRIIGHSDLALDSEGREVLVYQDIDTDDISILDLASGEITPLFAIDFSFSAIGLHFSGRAQERPGWALVSTHNGANPSATWMDDQVFAIELHAGGRVVRLAHTHSIVDESQEQDYWAEPHASVNQDFTRILFTSNWGRSGTDEVEMFMLELPSDWTESIPE